MEHVSREVRFLSPVGMGCYQHLLCVLGVICVLLITDCDAEIHRAKAAVHRTGVGGAKSRRTSTSYSDMEPDPNSQSTPLPFEYVPSVMFNAWTYSLLGAVLVGFSGIFPLLVIPLEAGPALKHGGKYYDRFGVGRVSYSRY